MPAPHPSRTPSIVSRMTLVLRCALILSMWNAPIPWFHTHDLVGPEVAQQQALAVHVDRFHAAELRLGQVSHEWHLHWILPWNPQAIPCDPEGESAPASPAEDVLISASHTVQFQILSQYLRHQPLGEFLSPAAAWGAGNPLPPDVVPWCGVIRSVQSLSALESGRDGAAVCRVLAVWRC
jgi:hypothetical protein